VALQPGMWSVFFLPIQSMPPNLSSRHRHQHPQPCRPWEAVLFTECISEVPEVLPALELVLPNIAKSTVICTLSGTLSHSPYTPKQLWLGENLSCLVGIIRKTRTLTPDEVNAICAMAAHYLR
jgi:hypothetical protein